MTTIDTSLDMTRGKDREYLRTAISAGWGLTHDDLAFYAKLLKTAALKAAQDGDTREMNSCVKTAAYIASMIQADEHKAVDKVVPDAPQEHRHFHVPAPRVLGESNGP